MTVRSARATPEWRREYLVRVGMMPLIERAAYEHMVTVDDVLGAGRSKMIVQARRAVALTLRAMGFSYPEIGRVLDRDHTTIIALVRRAA